MTHAVQSVIERRVRNLTTRVREAVIGETLPFTARLGRCAAPLPWARRGELAFVPVAEGDQWGETWATAWFHLAAEVPAAWAGSPVVAWIDLAGEVLLCAADGTPLTGLCQGSAFEIDYAKDIAHLMPACRGGERVELWAEAAANGLFGVTTTDPERNRDHQPLHGVHRGSVKRLRLARFDAERYGLLMDLEVLADLAGGLPEGSPRRAKLWRGLDRAVTAYDCHGTAAARAALAPLFAVPADPGAIRFTSVGHAHIDTAWLWPIAETRRKTARTFASQLDLLARYPDYVFGASQAQLYAFVKEDHPELYRRVQAAVAAGRWEVQGGMWVEADCNLPSGESLVRQLVHGLRWFKAEFGVRVRNLWLPDVFGYSAQLPQLLRRTGIGCFLTQKLSWNVYTSFPHNTFRWRGVDGSEVLAHFPPEDDYNARCRPGALIKAQERHRERAIVDEALSLFGIGDGGGGPKEEFLERARRMRDLNGCPPYRFGPAQPVLERMAQQAAEYEAWDGELYFELHRGTYTTQAGIKRANRRAEEALHAAELLAVACAGDAYPRAALDRLWKTVLTNQFHDIIPGSSIHSVYEQAVPEDDAAAAEALALGRTASAQAMRADADACTWVNPSPTAFDDLVALPAGWTGAMAEGRDLPAQRDSDAVRVRLRIAGHGAAVLRRGAAAPAVAAADDGLELDNGVVSARVGRDAQVLDLRLAGMPQPLLAGPGNRLRLFADRPHQHDAWDIDEQARAAPLDELHVESIRRDRGPLWQELIVHGRIGASRVVQRIRLRAGAARLDFLTEVDWTERHALLTVAFPTAIAARTAACEIQYGHVHRPTHRNTRADAAQFEVCAHRWVDLSGPDAGVALLNDSKYGYAVQGTVLELSLLRAPTYPDPVADQGRHAFTYALLPHAGDLPAAPQVRAEAAMLNAGAVALPGLAGPWPGLPARVEGDGLELAVCKAAEDEGGGVIVRVVEVRGAPARGRLLAPGRRIVPTDLVEWEDRDQDGGTGELTIDAGPFAVQTFRLR